MKAHCFQHVPFEGMGAIETWLKANGFNISYTRFYENDNLPDIASIDWLIIMGGPMSVNDEKEFTWLTKEKEFVRQCIAQNKKVIGICLGAQLIANSLGSDVFKNDIKEIGWFPIFPNNTGNPAISKSIPETLTVFHWHGETFNLPEGASLIASSRYCQNQIFSINNTVIGFQCHLETTVDSLRSLIANCSDELIPAKCIQNAEEMNIGFPQYAPGMHAVLFEILEKLLDK